MNAISLLVALLALAYVGSLLGGNRAIRGFGLPSSVEYVVLGVLAGPHVLGLIDRETVEAFEPVAVVALGWLAMVVGIDYGVVEGRRVTFRGLVGGIAVALLTGAGVAIIVFLLSGMRTMLPLTDRVVLSVGAGIVCSETTRHAVRWLAERHRAKGPLVDLLGDLADADDVVPLLALAVLAAIGPTPAVEHALPPWSWPLASVGLGVVMGGTVAALFGRRLVHDEMWAVLIGAALLTVGIAVRLGMPALTATFALGATVSLTSPHRIELRRLMAGTERPVLLPVLLLAGLYLDVRSVIPMWWLLAAAWLARLLFKLAGGVLLGAIAPVLRPHMPLAAVGLLPSGALTMAIGLALALRYPGILGQTILAIAALSTLLGEIIGAPALLRVAVGAGECRAEPGAPSEPVAEARAHEEGA